MKRGQNGRRRMAAWVALAFCAGLAGGRAGAQAESATEKAVPIAEKNDGTEKVVATVNSDPITETDYFVRLQRMRAQDFVISLNPLSLRGESSGLLALNGLIAERLTLQWAIKTKQMPTEADIDREMESQKKLPPIAQALVSRQLTEADLRQSVRSQLARFNIATTAVSISGPEVEKYYQAHLAAYNAPERWGLSGIRTTKANVVPKIQADLKAGKSFAEVVAAYSDDAKTRASEGQFGTVNANDPALPATIGEAVRKLKVGEVSPPIRIDASVGANRPKLTFWWFMRLTSREPAKVRPLSEIRTQVERIALLERAGGYTVADKKVADARRQADIRILLPGYESLANTPKRP